MLGKYFNGYAPERDGVPPGWDEWYVGGNAHASYSYVLNENGQTVQYGSGPEDYLGDVLTGKAVQLIRTSAGAEQPFFLYVLPFTPHSPSVAASRHDGMFAEAELPRPPSFVRSMSVTSRPSSAGCRRSMRTRSPTSSTSTGGESHRSRRSTTWWRASSRRLARPGGLDDTYVIYTSDNGFHLGEHRLIAGKDTPYEEDIRVPMVMRGPGVPVGERLDAMVVNIDLAPTFAEIAGVEAREFVDGRSFLPLLQDPERPWRESFLIERRKLEEQLVRQSKYNGLTPEEELDQAAVFNGIRTRELVYVEYGSGERELYDLAQDPHQLANLADEADPVLVSALQARLVELAECTSTRCRELEDLPLMTGEPSLVAAQPQ